MEAPSPRLTGLPPVLDADIRTLILGSFPSPASLAAGQYYGHPQNQFWWLLGAVLSEPLAQMSYAERTCRVLAYRIGIWDVYAACERPGALDASIRRAQANNLADLPRLAPNLCRVAFNGQTAARFARRIAGEGYVTIILPSSSPAYTLSFEAKLKSWRALVTEIPVRPTGRRD